MIAPEQVVRIRQLYFAEHWKVGTIASALQLHPDAVRGAIETDRFNRTRVVRASALLDPYLPFISATLEQYPRLRATRLYQMILSRGYAGSAVQLRRVVRRLRPAVREAFLPLRTFAGEQAQVDWAHFGEVRVGRARRKLSCFVLTLSYSRALALEFFFDQSLENFMTGHIRAFETAGGVARTLLYDNLGSVVVQRRGDAVQFHPRLLELAAHYHFAAVPCRPGRGSEKGRVERSIRYVRDSFFAARPFTTLADLNRQAQQWREDVALKRRFVDDDARTVGEALAEEQPFLLPLPEHPLSSELLRPIRSGKRIIVRFDLNDYSIPPEAVGRDLTLAATPTQVRLLDGTVEIARHVRSYDRHEIVMDPAHQQALLADKRKALGASRSSRLLSAAPEAETLLQQAVLRHEPAGGQTAGLLRLLDDYGAAQLRSAIVEALDRNSPRASSVSCILSRRHRQRQARLLTPVNLSRRPELADLYVQPHDPETYDDLADIKRD
jgi:transposase